MYPEYMLHPSIDTHEPNMTTCMIRTLHLVDIFES